MGDDPPYLTVGTEVSAKYKGAFCEAKVRKVVRSVKCKVTFKLGLGTISITDDQIRGTLRVGSVCEVKHPEKKEFVEAIINKIQDCSQYTVVFDDGDITTLRRTALCLKSGRHFAESETLDQLPLTHPEHFGNPVIGGRKGRRSRQAQEESSDEEDAPKKGKKKEEKEADIGKVVCVELGDKKKQKDNWFPGLVVAPTAQDTVRIRVKDEYLVRSFKDGRYFTVPKKEAAEFTREIGSRVDNNTLKAAVEKALQYLDRDELPPHWDRDLLFGLDDSSGNSDSDGALDSDSSDDEPREEKDHFVAQLYKFMDDRGTPINKGPTIGSRDVDLYKLFKVVHKLGGYNRVTNHNQWKIISQKLGFGQGSSSITNLVKQSYKKFLHSFEDFYRKLGCTMVNHPRGHRSKHRTGRSLIRDRDRATPTNIAKEKEKEKEKDKTALPSDKPTVLDSTEKDIVTTEKKVEPEEVKPIEEKKEETVKVKESTKKSKAREEKTESQSRQKSRDLSEAKEAKEAKEAEEEKEKEKEVKSRSKKDSKASEAKSRPSEEMEVDILTVPEKQPEPKPEPPEEESKSKDTKVKSKESKAKDKRSTADKPRSKDEKTTKTTDDDRGEESKKKVEKKHSTEDEEKQTRSKSKEDSRVRKESGPRESPRENRIPPRTRKEEEVPGQKKRGRKRKDNEEKAKEESLGHLASHVTLCIGDKLKVYYGPTHESKVTYEAKVLDIEEDGSECMYLVHYTGWNTRYDEWIKRGRIADNLSWTPSRAKRQRQQQSQHKASRPAQGKRGRPAGSTMRNQEGAGTPLPPHSTRSTTPSSVTSSSSRTKSPAARPGPRVSRSTAGGSSPATEPRRRTRRMSGHTDISVASDSESEEYDSDPEPESEAAQTRSKTERRLLAAEKEEPPAKETPPKEEAKRPAKKKPAKKKDSGESPAVPSAVASSSGADEEEEEKPTPEEKSTVAEPPSIEKRRSKRGKKSLGTLAEKKPEPKVDVKSETGTESEEEQPKGRDFDLNQIRSELKGIEKAVKLAHDLTPPPVSEGSEEDVPSKPSRESRFSAADKTSTPPKVEKEIETEDVYEFKEPEPFEFEVRKREPLLSDERGKLPRRSIARLLDVVEPPKVEKSPRKRQMRTPPKNEAKESPQSDSESKKKVRRTPVKKVEPPAELKSPAERPTSESKPPPPTAMSSGPTPKPRAPTACEQAFEKLCETPSFSLALRTTQASSPPPVLSLPDTDTEHSKSLELETLSILNETHDYDAEDDNEDRLVISEADDMVTEIAGPLFSYQQRDHEDLFPTLVTSEASTSTVDSGSLRDTTAKVEDPPCLTPVVPSAFHRFSSPLRESVADVGKESPRQGHLDGSSSSDTGHLCDSPSSRRTDDVIKQLLKPDEEYEDDHINQAIQRAIDQSMLDDEDDTGDIGLFSDKQPLSRNFKQDTKPEAGPSKASGSPKKAGASPKEAVRKRPSLLSPSYGGDSDTESSDEEERLVIDPMDEDVGSPGDCDASQSPALQLRLSESSDMETGRLQLEELEGEEEECGPEESSSASEIEPLRPVGAAIIVTEAEEEEEEEVDQEFTDADTVLEDEDSSSVAPVMTPVIVKMDLDDTTKVTAADLLPGSVVVLDASDTPAELTADPQATVVHAAGPEDPSTTAPILALASVPLDEAEAAEAARQEANRAVDDPDSQLLGSLLCQETIPGSPAQAADSGGDEAPPEGKVLVLEMPFASVPASTCDSTLVPPVVMVPAPAVLPPPPPPTTLAVSLAIPVVPVVAVSAPAPMVVAAPTVTLTVTTTAAGAASGQQHSPARAEASVPAPPHHLALPSPGMSKHNPSEAAPVMDNTPPTTPDSSLSTMSGSPREEHGDMSPAMDNESSKSHRDSFEMDLDSCPEGTKVGHYSEDDSLLNVEVSNSCESRLQGLKLLPKKVGLELDKDTETSPKKRRRSRKRSDSESNKRVRCSSSRTPRAAGTGSDSDDTSENSTLGCTPLSTADTLASKSPRPSKYNFYVELDPELDGSQRIALLQQKLQELRKTYMNVKAELACIDRRRKKLRRREREVEKATKQEVACS